MKFLLYFILLFSFSSCSEDNSIVAEVRNVVTKKNDERGFSEIGKFYGDYYNADFLCCEQCEISEDDAQKILKNEKVFKNCTNTSARIATMYIVGTTFTILIFGFAIALVTMQLQYNKN